MDNLQKILDHNATATRENLSKWPDPKYTPGQTFNAYIPFGQDVMKVHIEHVIPSYYARWNIIYRVYGKHKQWWHEFMCSDEDMDWYIERSKKD